MPETPASNSGAVAVARVRPAASKLLAWAPSQQFKDSFKIALAMVLAVGISLAMDWEKPYWAGFAVAFCSLTGTGDSINKGLLRVSGTAVAAVMTLVLVGLFPQDRWLFLMGLTAYTGFCTYMMGGTTRWYFWFVAGFTVAIMAFGADGQSLSTFNNVTLRAQETVLGVLVYSLVAVLIWPSSSTTRFQAAVQGVVATEEQFARSVFHVLKGNPEGESPNAVRAGGAPALASLKAALDGAEMGSLEIRASRHAWRQLIAEIKSLARALDRWHQGLQDIGDLDLSRCLKGVEAFEAEILQRFDDIQETLKGNSARHTVRRVQVAREPARTAALSHFQLAALQSCITQMNTIEVATENLYHLLGATRGSGFDTAAPRAVPQVEAIRTLDPDRFANAVRSIAAIWIAAIVWILVPDAPLGTGLIMFTTSLSMVITTMPAASPMILLVPSLLSILLAGSVHVLVMPQLSGYGQLGVLLFVMTFALCYWLPASKYYLGRMVGLAMLVVNLSITNEQTYSVLGPLNYVVGIPIVIGILAIARFVPVSFRAETRFARLLSRFFNSSAFVSSAGYWQQPPTLSFRLRRAFHAAEQFSLPGKLGGFSGGVAAKLGADGQSQVAALMASLQALSNRMKELDPGLAKTLPGGDASQLFAEIEDWRAALETLFRELADHPGDVDPDALRARLDAKVDRLEQCVADTLENASAAGYSEADENSIYRTLGTLRGISEDLITVATHTATLDWDRLRESRF